MWRSCTPPPGGSEYNSSPSGVQLLAIKSTTLVEPSNAELARKLGLVTKAKRTYYTAALMIREHLKTVQ